MCENDSYQLAINYSINKLTSNGQSCFSVRLSFSPACTSPLMPHLVTNTFNSQHSHPKRCVTFIWCHPSPKNFICFRALTTTAKLGLISLLFLSFSSSSLSLLHLYHHYAQSRATNLSPSLSAQATNQQLMSISPLVTGRHSFGL